MNDFDRRIAALSPEQRALLKLRLNQKQSLKPSQTSVIPKRVKDNYPAASFAQQRMWFQDQMSHKSATSNNIPVSLEIKGQLDVKVLERSIKEIVQRHKILRTTLKTVNGRLVQIISPAVDFSLLLIDLCALSPAEREAKKTTANFSRSLSIVRLVWQLVMMANTIDVIYRHGALVRFFESYTALKTCKRSGNSRNSSLSLPK